MWSLLLILRQVTVSERNFVDTKTSSKHIFVSFFLFLPHINNTIFSNYTKLLFCAIFFVFSLFEYCNSIAMSFGQLAIREKLVI